MANNVIGLGPEEMTSGREYKKSPTHTIFKSVVISSAARDSSQTYLRKGLVLGKVTSSGKYMQYDDNNSPAGIGVARCILDEDCDLVNAAGVVADAVKQALIHGWVDSNQLFGIDANGKTDLATTTNGCCILFD